MGHIGFFAVCPSAPQFQHINLRPLEEVVVVFAAVGTAFGAVLADGVGMRVGRRFPSYVRAFGRRPTFDVVADVEAVTFRAFAPLPPSQVVAL